MRTVLLSLALLALTTSCATKREGHWRREDVKFLSKPDKSVAYVCSWIDPEEDPMSADETPLEKRTQMTCMTMEDFLMVMQELRDMRDAEAEGGTSGGILDQGPKGYEL